MAITSPVKWSCSNEAGSEFKTDDAGTLYLDGTSWRASSPPASSKSFTEDGRRFLWNARQIGGIDRSASSVPTGRTSLVMAEVALIRAIGRGFWNKLDGSIDAGYNYTKSSGVAQFSLNWDSVYQKPASRFRLTASTTITQKDDDSGRDDRGTIEMSYLRYPWQHWFITAAGRFENNESLGLVLRSQVGGGRRSAPGQHEQSAAGSGRGAGRQRRARRGR